MGGRRSVIKTRSPILESKCSIMLPAFWQVSASFPRFPTSVVVPFLPHASRLGPREGDGRGERERESIMRGHGLSPPYPPHSLPSATKHVGLAMRICRGRPRSALSRISQASLSLSDRPTVRVRPTDGHRPWLHVSPRRRTKEVLAPFDVRQNMMEKGNIYVITELRRMVARSKASVSHAGGREFETASGLHPRFDAS